MDPSVNPMHLVQGTRRQIEFGTGFLPPETGPPKGARRRRLRAETGNRRPPHAEKWPQKRLFCLAQCGKSLTFRRPNLGRQERNFWMRRQSRQNRRQRQRTPAETIKGRTDSGNPGTNGLFEPDRKTPGSAGLGGGGCKSSETR